MRVEAESEISQAKVLAWLIAGICSVAERRSFWQFGTVLITVTLGAAATATAPLYLRDLVNQLDGARRFVDWWPLIGYVGLFLVAGVLAGVRWIIYGPVEQQWLHALSVTYLDRILSQAIQKPVGAIQSTLVQAQNGQRTVLMTIMLSVVPTLTEVVFVLAVAAVFLNGGIATIVCLAVLFYGLVTWYSANLARRHQKEGQKRLIAARGLAAEGYLNAETTRLYNARNYIVGRYADSLATVRDAFRRFYWIRTASACLQAVALAAALGLSLAVSIREFSVGMIDMGEVVLVNALVLQTLRPVQMLNLHYREIKMGLTSIEHLITMFDRQGETVPSGSVRWKNRQQGPTIRAKDVGTEHTDPVSFEIRGGETTALVGRSGTGKTSIIRAIAKSVRVTTGKLTVDGISVDELDTDDWRRHFAIVEQEGLLFHDTVRSNILLGRDDLVSDVELESLLDLVGLDNIRQRGLNMDCGPRGSALSGGERQRVAILRAMIRSPSLIILDETLAQLDIRRALLALNIVRRALPRSTIIVVTHSADIADLADNVVDLNRRGIETPLVQHG